jgi:hypothetical protein
MNIYTLLKIEGDMKEAKTSFSLDGIKQIVEHISITDESESVYYLYEIIMELGAINCPTILIASGTIKEVQQFLKNNLI